MTNEDIAESIWKRGFNYNAGAVRAALANAARLGREDAERERDAALAALRELRSTTTAEAWMLIVPRIDAILAKHDVTP